MKFIPLTQGKVAMVDDADYEWLAQWKWFAIFDHGNWYAVRNVRKPDGTQTPLRMHRVLLGLTDLKIEVDHRDGNGLNNQRHNLRIATHGQNMCNRSMQKNNISGVRGVCWHKDAGKW